MMLDRPVEVALRLQQQAELGVRGRVGRRERDGLLVGAHRVEEASRPSIRLREQVMRFGVPGLERDGLREPLRRGVEPVAHTLHEPEQVPAARETRCFAPDRLQQGRVGVKAPGPEMLAGLLEPRRRFRGKRLRRRRIGHGVAPPYATPSESASATSAALKHAIGARTMPAPIWPTPASRWAIPVVSTGRIPVSTTLRRSMPAGAAAKSRFGSDITGLRAQVTWYISRV